MPPERDQFNFRISPQGRRILETLANYYGITKSGVVEMLLRKAARDEGIDTRTGVRHGPGDHGR